jgi:hypothetical protein
LANRSGSRRAAGLWCATRLMSGSSSWVPHQQQRLDRTHEPQLQTLPN